MGGFQAGGGGLGRGGGQRAGGQGTFPSTCHIYCTTTWCFALKGLRTIKHGVSEADAFDEESTRVSSSATGPVSTRSGVGICITNAINGSVSKTPTPSEVSIASPTSRVARDASGMRRVVFVNREFKQRRNFNVTSTSGAPTQKNSE